MLKVLSPSLVLFRRVRWVMASLSGGIFPGWSQHGERAYFLESPGVE